MLSFALFLFLLIGFVSGFIAGLFGIGGGILIVPALMYLAGFSQSAAVGTSLFVILLPTGLGAVIERYRHGDVHILGGLAIALAFFISAWISSKWAYTLNTSHLKLSFGLFVIGFGCYICYEAWVS